MAVIRPSFVPSKWNLYLKAQFLSKNDGEKWSRKKTFEIHPYGKLFSLLRKIVVLSMSLSMQHTIKILWFLFSYNGPSQDYQNDRYPGHVDYDYDYDILADKLSLPTRSVDNAAPSLNAAPKASASDSQDNSAFRTNSMLPGISNSYVLCIL